MTIDGCSTGSLYTPKLSAVKLHIQHGVPIESNCPQAADSHAVLLAAGAAEVHPNSVQMVHGEYVRAHDCDAAISASRFALVVSPEPYAVT